MSDGIPRVFLSYSSADREFANSLAEDLARFPLKVWFDRWEILVGDSILQRIGSALNETDYLAIVLSPDSVTSPWVAKELNTATIRQLNNRDVRILPLLYRECAIPPLLKEIRYADFSSDYQAGLTELLRCLSIKPQSEGQTKPDVADPLPIGKLLHRLREEGLKAALAFEFVLLAWRNSILCRAAEADACLLSGQDGWSSKFVDTVHAAIRTSTSLQALAEQGPRLEPGVAAQVAAVLDVCRTHCEALSSETWCGCRRYLEAEVFERQSKRDPLGLVLPDSRDQFYELDHLGFYSVEYGGFWSALTVLARWGSRRVFKDVIESRFGAHIPYERVGEAFAALAEYWGYNREHKDYELLAGRAAPRLARLAVWQYTGAIRTASQLRMVLIDGENPEDPSYRYFIR